jgi:hypothetical protein
MPWPRRPAVTRRAWTRSALPASATSSGSSMRISRTLAPRTKSCPTATQGIQLQRLAANNPVGAESAGIVGDAIQQANALRKQGYGALALQSLGVSGLRLDASKAAYLRSLGASDIDSRFNTTAGNVAPTPTEVLGQFAQAKAQLLGAGIANVGGRIGQFLSNIDPTGFMGGAGGGGGNGDVVRKLEETAQRFENAIKNIVSE